MSTSSLPTENPVPVKEIHLSKDEFDKLPDLAQNAIKASGIPLKVTASVAGETRTFSVRSATVDKEKNLAGIISTLRYDWGNGRGDFILSLNWGAVKADTAVFAAVGEGAPGGPIAGKFIGDAKFTLFNVAPRNNAVDIWINVNFDVDLRIYADYLVARGCRDQNAGTDPGWLVAARGSKKKMDVIIFFAL